MKNLNTIFCDRIIFKVVNKIIEIRKNHKNNFLWNIKFFIIKVLEIFFSFNPLAGIRVKSHEKNFL